MNCMASSKATQARRFYALPEQYALQIKGLSQLADQYENEALQIMQLPVQQLFNALVRIKLAELLGMDKPLRYIGFFIVSLSPKGVHQKIGLDSELPLDVL